MSYYTRINELYPNYNFYSKYSYDNKNDNIYYHTIKIYELLLKIILYNECDDIKFDIFYKKYMANFKLNQYYNIRNKKINCFKNSEDFIDIIYKLKIDYSYLNFFKEIHIFLSDIVIIIEKEQELQNKLNASIITNNISSEVNNNITEEPKSFYNKVCNQYNKLNYFSSSTYIKTLKLLLEILYYNDCDDINFDIFYKKHMANFIFKRYYFTSYMKDLNAFNKFINSADFIDKIINVNYDIDFYKEMYLFLTDICKIIEKEKELKNKLNASIITNDILNNIFPQIINNIPEKPKSDENIESKKQLKEYNQICKVLENRGFNNILVCIQKKQEELKNKLNLSIVSNIIKKLEENPPMYCYNRIIELYNLFRRKSNLNAYYNYHVNVYNILLKIINNYADNNYDKFDIFYKTHMSNFKLNKYYSATILYYSNISYKFNSFDNTKDFIDKICCIYDNINFYKELSILLINVINITEKQEELKLNIPEKQQEEKINIIESINKNKKKKPISATMKRLVWNTHIGEEIGKYKCLCCNITAITQLSFNCGHIIAEANGGATIVSNLKPICQNCNSSMGTKNMHDFMQTFK